MEAMDFVAKFIKHFDTVGIYDEFDKDTQKMVTSRKVYELAQDARSLMPKKIKPMVASTSMADLSDADRDRLIADAGTRVVDMRTAFSKKIAANGGTRALLEGVLLGDPEVTEAALQFVRAEKEGGGAFSTDSN